MLNLTAEELSRYARQITLPELGIAGQAKLKASSVLLIGVGGLGSPLALYLAAAGVGRLGLVDADVVELSNLHRQVIHQTSRLGTAKVDSAAAMIAEINPHVQVDIFAQRFTPENALQIAADYDLLIDGTDNFATRYLVNDVSVLLDKPNCYGSIYRFEGQASVFNYRNGPCYRCLFPEPPPSGLIPNCAEAGVLGVLPGLVGTIQATEAIKVLLGKETTLAGRLLLINALEMNFRELAIQKNPSCSVCGSQPTVREVAAERYQIHCDLSSSSQPASDQAFASITVETLRDMRERDDDFFLLDVREPYEQAICSLGGVLIPLAELGQRIKELPSDRPIVVHCLSGGRSSQAVEILNAAGFDNVLNLEGGLRAWAEKCEPSLPMY